MYRRLFAGVSLVLVAILWWRLDVDTLQTAIEAQASHLGGSGLQAQRVSLSLMHGVGLRLDDVTFTNTRLTMQAGHLNISLHLLPLLFGKIETGTLDIYDAQIKLRGDAVAGLSASFASMPFDRVQLTHSTLEDASDIPQLENLHLDVRNIGLDREALWEVSARQGGYALQGHGELAFRAGEVMSGFGKLKFKAIPASLLSAFIPVKLTRWLDEQKQFLTGGLTLDITRHDGWSLVGEIASQGQVSAVSIEQSPVRLRGKLSQSIDGTLAWHDSFIHLQDSAVVALDGQCRQGQCETHMDARHVPIGAWFKLLSKPAVLPPLVGDTRLTAMLNWHDDQWQATGKLGLSSLSYRHGGQTMALPSMRLSVSGLHGNQYDWMGQAQLSFADLEGKLDLQLESLADQSGQESNTKSRLRDTGWQLKLASAQLADGVWQPLGNLLLSTLKLAPQLSGNGPLQAEMILKQYPEHAHLKLEIDAAEAAMNYVGRWQKSVAVAAFCRAAISWQSDISHPESLQLDGCHLASAQLDHLQYRQGSVLDRLQFSGLLVDMNVLNEHKVGLPAYQGRLEAAGMLAWQHDTGKLVDAGGEWNLQQFGTANWQVSGDLTARDGIIGSEHLQVSGNRGQAELRGRMRLASHRGWVDLLSGSLDWKAMPPLPDIWSDFHVNGKVHQLHVNVAGYQWQDIDADYDLRHDRVKLLHGSVGFAGGVLDVEDLELIPVAGALRMDGKLKARDIQLEQAPWLSDWLQAGLSGKMQANVELKGSLPLKGLADWQRSNGDITIYSGDWMPPAGQGGELAGVQEAGMQQDVTTPVAGNDDHVRVQSAAEFKSLIFRFRIHEQDAALSGIDLISHGKRYRGEANISADGVIAGTVQGNVPYHMAGIWPYPLWQERPETKPLTGVQKSAE
ncbi:MAG: glutamyl-tRNA amidotransferase [Mariprofundus sp.]